MLSFAQKGKLNKNETFSPCLRNQSFCVTLGLLGPDVACTIFEVPIGSTSVYVEQDTPDQNLLGKQRLKLVQ